MTTDPSGPDASVSEEIEGIKAEIARFIDAELERRQPVYLSTLGHALRDRLVRIKELTGQQLGNIVEHDLAGRYQIVRVGTHKNILTLYKLGQDVSDTPPAASTGGGSSRIRYARDLWLAFAIPSTTPFRYIDLKTLKFINSDEATAPEGHLLIEREFLRGPDDPHSPDEILSRIGQWFAKVGVDPSSYLAKEKPVASPKAQGRSLLELMLASLDRRQQQSVTLPLDVVDALLRNRP